MRSFFVALTVVLGLSSAGCGGASSTASSRVDGSDDPAVTSSAGSRPSSSSPAVHAPSASGPESALPTLPPGDPGPGPSVPEDTSGTEPHPDDPRTSVPVGALLDAGTVAAVVGGSWRSTAAPADSCDAPRPTSPTAPVATRTAALTGTRGQLVETVATHADREAAVRTVDAMAKRLRGCGWTLEEEPPLGEDSALLTRSTSSGTEPLVIVAAEGVTVTMLGRGPVATSADDWAAIVDVAIGTSCLAAPDGCH